jgi:hypothetical protein
LGKKVKREREKGGKYKSKRKKEENEREMGSKKIK